MAKRICVFGSYKKLDKKSQDIIKLGRLLAERDFEVITGGFGGTMEDISRGAKEAGGKTIGVTYYRYADTAKKPNKYIDREIKTKNIFERINVMMKESNGFIVLPGGTGTLLELAAVLEHINKGLMQPKPIIALGDYWKNVAEILAEEVILNKTVKASSDILSCRDLITFVDTPEEAVDALLDR